MKKVGIITIIDNNNYGNRLQNYALQNYLSNMEANVETLLNIYRTNNKGVFLAGLIKNMLEPYTTFSDNHQKY